MKLADLIKDIPLTPSRGSLPHTDTVTSVAARGLAADTSTAATLEISGLTADSRQVRPGMLFAALSGTKADGMAYAKAAEAAGAVAVLAGETANADGLTVPVLRAEEPRQALALFAARFYRFQPDTIAAVTGTNGKTSVAAFLRQIWATAGHDAASLGTIGIITNAGERPLSHTTPDPVVLHKTLADLANEGVTHLALEASSHGLDQHRLDGVRFSAGAFTNITRDHLDYHPSFEDYFNAKMRLFRNLLPPGAPAVIDADGDHADDVVGAARARKLDVMTVGEHGAALCLKGVERDGFRQRLSIIYRGRLFTVLLPLAGAFQVSNALVSAGLALGLGSSPGGVFEALETLRGAKGRLDYVGETAEGAPIFVDYAHTPDALVKALEALRPYVTGRLHVVFGCGGDRDRGKRPEMGRAATANADVVYVTDDNPRSEEPAEIRAAIMAAAPGATEIDGRGDAIATAIGNLERGDVLLVAGKGHETGQIVGAKVIPYSDHEAVAAALAHIGERRASHG